MMILTILYIENLSYIQDIVVYLNAEGLHITCHFMHKPISDFFMDIILISGFYSAVILS